MNGRSRGRPSLGEDRAAGPSARVNLRLTHALNARLLDLAERQGRSVSDVLRAALTEYADRRDSD